MKATCLTALGALLFVSMTTAAGAHPLSHQRFMHETALARKPLISIMLRHHERLGLGEEQVATLRSLRIGFQKEAIKRRAALRVAELELDELLGKEPLDLATIEAKLAQIERLRVEGRLSRIKTIDKGKALLTPEQRKKLADLPAELAKEKLEKRKGSQGMKGMEGMEQQGMQEEMMGKPRPKMGKMGGMGRGTMGGMMRGMSRGMMGKMMSRMSQGMMTGCPGMMAHMMEHDASSV